MIDAILKKYQNSFLRVIDYDYHSESLTILDLTRNNDDLNSFDVNDPREFSFYIKKKLIAAKSRIGIGLYLEDRDIYKSDLFAGTCARTVHLGIDLWVDSGVRVFAPLPGVIHSYGDNRGKGDYGPTVILEHMLENRTFYTLYGHLDRLSLCDKMEGVTVSAGAQIGTVGTYPENGDYPSHLHFEIITDMCGKKGDFPGVCAKKDIDEYMKLCPDPNNILQISL